MLPGKSSISYDEELEDGKVLGDTTCCRSDATCRYAVPDTKLGTVTLSDHIEKYQNII